MPLRGNYARLGCPFILLAVLFWGQRLRTLIGRPRYVFLDKLCIHQTDEDKKLAGVLGLAGFLRASSKLVVIWSPRYFSRLWCTYELVTWCYLNGLDPQRVRFIPVAVCTMKLTVTFAFLCNEMARIVFHRMHYETFDNWMSTGALYIHNIGAFLFLLPMSYCMFSTVRHLGDLKDQVRSFSIRDAKCFCCTHNHLHPDTGERIACDRLLVYQTLHDWYIQLDPEDGACSMTSGQSGPRLFEDGSAAALDSFDDVVRHKLLIMLSRTTNGALRFFSYRECVFLAVPQCWKAIDYAFSSIYEGNYWLGALWMLEISSVQLFVFPLSLAITVKVDTWLVRLMRGYDKRLRLDVLGSAITGLALFFSFVLLWLPGPILMDLNGTNAPAAVDLVFLLRYIALALLTVYVMYDRRPPVDEAALQEAQSDNVVGAAGEGDDVDLLPEAKSATVCTI
eukprot:TRINITY_DN25645_c0_g1_i1.p1 TRINITY_DN25645_c0_g1~~TRINITY_DN25645_c0_g1_i1.p1  ORF type:complete len:505 (+),score=19.94 TRINITY_DN25645_c0_g1_i1:166-1515(+)